MLSASGESDAHADNAAARAAPSATTIASLPHAVLARVFERLPVDTRLRCCEVCRGWRHVLATERSLWTALDLSETSGVTHEVTDALLRAAAAKAGGALETLDVTGCSGLSLDAGLAVMTVDGGNLLEMRAAGAFSPDDGDRAVEVVTTLLHAAPRLRLLVADVYCEAAEATRMLRNEGVFQQLRIHELDVDAFEADDAALTVFIAALAAHALPLMHLWLHDAQLDAADVLDALVDAALANRLAAVTLEGCELSPASAPSLVRLLGGGALTRLHIYGMGEQLLDAPAAALLAGALRTNTVLHDLKLSSMYLWVDLSAVMTLLTSLVAHPSLQSLNLCDGVAPEHAACAGAALFALVAANVPALTELHVRHCGLGDVGLRPLMDALPRNTHLRTLDISFNRMSEAFARDVLLPAVRANTSLTELETEEAHAGAVEAEAIASHRRRAAM
jgi:hypothetical protein